MNKVKPKFVHTGKLGRHSWRAAILIISLFMIVGIAVFAQHIIFENEHEHEIYEPAHAYVYANEFGVLDIWPPDIEYELYYHDGTAAFIFARTQNMGEIIVNVPYYWDYTIGYDCYFFYNYDWLARMAFVYETDTYYYREIIILAITPPEGYFEWDDYYYGFYSILRTESAYYHEYYNRGYYNYAPGYYNPYEYYNLPSENYPPGYNPYDYRYESGHNNYYNYENAGYAGYAPGYIGIVPAVNFTVTFNNNDGGFTLPTDFATRSTLLNSTVGNANMPPNPVWPGHQFFAWTRSQNGMGIGIGTAAGEHFTGTSTVNAGEDPFTVYAQWGYFITFNCEFNSLNIPGTPNPGVTAQHVPRAVHGGRTFTDSNALSWTSTQVWPSNPASRTEGGNQFFFVGWYTKDASDNFFERFIPSETIVNGHVQVHARWRQRVMYFDLRDGVTNPEDFPYHYLTGTAGGLAIGDTYIPGRPGGPPAPVHPLGHHFMAFTRDAVGDGTSTTAGAGIRITGTQTFTLANSSPGTIFAQWGHELTFVGNGADPPLNIPGAPNPGLATHHGPRIVAAGRSFAWTAGRTWAHPTTTGTNHVVWPNNPARPGYVFGGWFTRENNDYAQQVNIDTIINSDKTLYARWVPAGEYTGRVVIFNPQNGTAPPLFEQVPTLPAGNIGTDNWPSPNPTNAGYHFMTWTRTPDGSGSATGNADGVVFNANSTITIGQSPFTVYAQWGHQVSFNLNGFGGTVPAARVYRAGLSANESNALIWTTAASAWPANPANTTTQNFVGWYTRDINNEYAQRFDANEPIDRDIVLFARYTSRRVIFDVNDGGHTPPEDFEWRPLGTANNASVGTSSMPDDPMHYAGHRFLAWTRTRDGRASTVPPVATNNTTALTRIQIIGTATFNFANSPSTVYAQWGHRITFNGDGIILSPPVAPRYAVHGMSMAESDEFFWLSSSWPANPTQGRALLFAGWYEQGATEPFCPNTPVYNDVYLYARWVRTRVYFDPNDGVTQPDAFQFRELQLNGTVGAANMPTPTPPPLPDGRHFINWVRPSCPYGSWGTLISISEPTPFAGGNIVHLLLTPLTVWATYGWQVTFDGGPITLPAGTTATGFGPRFVYPGHSLASSNDLPWTLTVGSAFPIPANTGTLTFMGWYIQDGSGNNIQRVFDDTIITENTTLHARWVPRVLTFNPRDGVTLPGDFETRALSTAGNGAIQGGMPSNPTSPRGDGLHFIAWTRTADGLGTGTTAAAREHVIQGTTFPQETQAWAYGQWGYRIQFHGNGVVLPDAFNTPRFVLPDVTMGTSFGRRWMIDMNNTWPGYPDMPGREFLGWYTRDTFGDLYQRFIFDPAMMPSGDLELYARWQTGKVYFNPQDGSVGPLDYRYLAEDTGTVGAGNMPVVTRTGYRFWHWTRTADGMVAPPWVAGTAAATGLQFTDTSTVYIEYSPLTVYAQWGHLVNFDINGGTVVPNNSGNRIILTGLSNFENNALPWTTVLQWANNPVRTGFTFVGWYTRDVNGDYDRLVCGVTPMTHELINPGSLFGDITLYARWIPTTPMEVIFNPNDDGATLPANFHVGLTEPNGSVLPSQFAPAPVWGNRVFLAWTRTPDGTGTTTGITDGIRFIHHTSATNTSTITYAQMPFSVYAQWGHTVRFDGNGITLSTGATATGYGPRIISSGRNVAGHNALVWTTTVFPTTVIWPNNPTRAGYGFLGWYTRDGNGEYHQRVDATTIITSDLQLYAKWDSFRTVFHTNGGYHVGYAGLPNVTVERPLGQLPPAPFKTGAVFLNWTRTQTGSIEAPWVNTSAAANGIVFNLTSTIPVAVHYRLPVSVYAQWGHTISFNGNGMDLPNQGSLLATGYGTRIAASGRTVAEHNFYAWATPNITWPNNPVRPDRPGGNPFLMYRFVGWGMTHNNAPGGTFTGIFDPTTTEVYRHLILYAQWEPTGPFTVTFDDTGGALTAGHSNTRQSWPGSSVAASSEMPTGQQLNTSVLWPRSAPDVTRTSPQPMTVGHWRTVPGGIYAGGDLWSMRGWNSTNNIVGNTTGLTAGLTGAGQGRATTIVDADITVYPHWVYRITYMPNGGSISHTSSHPPYRDIPARWCPDTNTYLPGTLREHGRTATNLIQREHIQATHSISRANHIFVGWWSHPIPPSVPLGEEVAHNWGHAYEFTVDTEVYRNRNVYARWIPIRPNLPIDQYEPDPPVRIPVHFDLNNGGRWWAPPALPPGGEYDVRTILVNQGSNVTNAQMPQFPIPRNDGYIFMGWFPTPSGPASFPSLDDRFLGNGQAGAFPIQEETTLYAHWEPYVILTVCSNSGNPVGNRYRPMAIGRNFAEMHQIWHGTAASGLSGNARPPGAPASNYFANPTTTGTTGINGNSIQAQTTHPTLARAVNTQFWAMHTPDAGAPFFINTTRVYAPMTIFARWMVTLTFNNNRNFFANANNSTDPHSQIPVNNNMIQQNIQFPTHWDTQFTDGVIIGWNTAIDGTGTTWTRDMPITANTTLFAMWVAYIVFCPNGAPDASLPDEHRRRIFSGVGMPMTEAVSPYDSSVVGWPPDPVWTGHTFMGWNLQPNGRGVTIQHEHLITGDPYPFAMPHIMKLYAIWDGTITFDPNGGQMRPGIAQPHTTTPESRSQRIHEPLEDQTATLAANRRNSLPRELERYGWRPATVPNPVSGGNLDYVWSTTRFALATVSDITCPIQIRDIAFRYYHNVTQSKTIYAQWHADVFFICPDGGTVDGQPSADRAVPETGTVNDNTTGMPVPFRTGYEFLEWVVRIVDENTGGYTWETFTGDTEICDETPFGRFLRDNQGRIRVEPRWGSLYVDFAFYKTNMAIYPQDGEEIDLNELEYLEGARFHLYRWDAGNNEWEIVNNNLLSDSNGRVEIIGMNAARQYRLREVTAPVGYVTPPAGSYWLIHFTRIPNTNTYIVESVSEHGGTLPFVPVHVGVCDDTGDDIYYLHVGNEDGIRFPIHKTDHNGNLLEGAHFALFRTATPAAELSTGTSGLVTIDTSGNPSYPWEIVDFPSRYVSTGDINTPIYFYFASGYVYQLVEFLAPAGFQIPMGQWRIVEDGTAESGFLVIPIGNLTIPPMRYVPCLCDAADCRGGSWHISNWPMPELPLAGGSGALTLPIYVAATVMLTLAFIGGMLIVTGKLNKAKK
ncbi:MAG: InlB B-repeat-containing protein [Defluviitaleaceae bacterium]|nr:InlB B-repeat-containing protein [Defluviitaleaceae bacterium]